MFLSNSASVEMYYKMEESSIFLYSQTQLTLWKFHSVWHLGNFQSQQSVGNVPIIRN